MISPHDIDAGIKNTLTAVENVENRYYTHASLSAILFAIFVPRIIKVGLNLTKFGPKQFRSTVSGHCTLRLNKRQWRQFR